jgi:hypothetical protein
VRLPHDQRVPRPGTARRTPRASPRPTPGETSPEHTGKAQRSAAPPAPPTLPALPALPALPVLLALLALLAAISYSTFLLEHLLSPGHDSVNAYVSELSAVDQPYHAVYGGGDLVTGVLAIGVALTALCTPPHRPWSVLGWTFLALFGLGAIGDAVFPLECAPSLDTRCALLEHAGRLGFAHSFHTVTSSLVIVFGVAALLALSIAARRYGRWPVLARWGLPLAAAETVLAAGTVTAMLLGHWLGIIQRVQISVLVAGLAAIAWALYADRPRAPGRVARPGWTVRAERAVRRSPTRPTRERVRV